MMTDDKSYIVCMSEAWGEAVHAVAVLTHSLTVHHKSLVMTDSYCWQLAS